MSARGGKHSVVAGDCRSHAEIVEKHGSEGGQQGGAKIKMQERLRSSLLVPAKKLEKRIAAEMMNDSGGQKDVSGVLFGKSIAVNELAQQVFGGCQAAGLANKSGIEIHADQFDVVLREGNVRGEPACRIARAAADVRDAQSVLPPSLPNGSDHTAEKFPDAASMIKLLGKALHFPVDRQEQRVNGTRIKNAVALRKRLDHPQRLAIAKL